MNSTEDILLCRIIIHSWSCDTFNQAVGNACKKYNYDYNTWFIHTAMKYMCTCVYLMLQKDTSN